MNKRKEGMVGYMGSPNYRWESAVKTRSVGEIDFLGEGGETMDDGDVRRRCSGHQAGGIAPSLP